MPLALSTGHEVGLAVTAGVFIAFAIASSFLFPRFRQQYPAGGLPAFIVVSFILFFGMLAAVEKFGAEGHEGVRVAETTPAQTTTSATTTPPPSAAGSSVTATETEFKIAVPSTSLKAGKVTFHVKNDGKIEHDLAIKGMSAATKLIPPGGSATLTVTLKPGSYELYCSVPGHEAAGMKLKVTVS